MKYEPVLAITCKMIEKSGMLGNLIKVPSTHTSAFPLEFFESYTRQIGLKIKSSEAEWEYERVAGEDYETNPQIVIDHTDDDGLHKILSHLFADYNCVIMILSWETLGRAAQIILDELKLDHDEYAFFEYGTEPFLALKDETLAVAVKLKMV